MVLAAAHAAILMLRFAIIVKTTIDMDCTKEYGD